MRQFLTITLLGLTTNIIYGCADEGSEAEALACEYECLGEDQCGEPNVLHDDMTCDEEGLVCCEVIAVGGDTSTEEDTSTETAAPEDTGTGPEDTGTGPEQSTGSGEDTDSDTGTGGDTASDTGTGEPPDTGTGSEAEINSGFTCAEAIVVRALPYSHSGSTTDTGNQYGFDDGDCPDVVGDRGSGSNDVVYVFTPPSTAVYTIEVDGFDVSPYVVTDCDNIETTCVAATDEANEGVETLIVELEEGVVYYIIVDGWSPTQNVAGDYTLTVSEPCVPDCEDKMCGDDGCGRECGVCDEGYNCNADGACEIDTTTGNTCDYPYIVTELPFVFGDDTTVMHNLYGAKEDECPGLAGPVGNGSNDSVYELTPEETGRYTITVNDDFDSAVYVVTDCAAIDTSCLGGVNTPGSGENLIINLEADTTYYIIVDGWSSETNEDGTYTIAISDVCVPDCGGKECGDDGCGGSCGDCAENEVCNDDQVCEAYSGHGDNCDDPFIVDAVPYTRDGDTTPAGPDFSVLADDCPGGGGNIGPEADDEVYMFTPEVYGAYTITVDGAYDTAFYIATNCEDVRHSCVMASAASSGPNPEEATVLLDADTTYYIVVDGDIFSGNLEGAYTITISEPCIPDCDTEVCGPDDCGFSCGECSSGNFCDDTGQCQPFDIEGDSCVNPTVVPSVPYSDMGDTTYTNNAHSFDDYECPDTLGAGGGSNDAVYSFTPTTSGVYTISAESTGYDSTIYVATNCDDMASTCLGAVLEGVNEPSLNVILEQDTAYFIIFDGESNGSNFAGPYSLSISEPCIQQCDGKDCGPDGCGLTCGECGPRTFCDSEGICQDYTGVGDVCDDPVVVDEIPYLAAGDTSLADNHYRFISGACPGVDSAGAGSNEEVHAFTPSVTGAYTITLTPDVAFDSTLYVVTNCNDTTSSCLGADDTLSTEELTLMLEAGTTYYIVVDGWGNSSNDEGAYTLEIAEPCLPDCDGKECGDNGCGFPCGVCAPGSFCDENDLCQLYDTLGDSCINPYLIDAVPFSDTGDTTAANNAYGVDNDDCPGLDYATGGASNDIVYAFTPETTGYYIITTDDGYDNAVYVVTECTDIGSTCVMGAEDDIGEILDVLLEADTTYYIVIDGAGSSSNGPYELAVTDVCEPDCAGKECGDDGCGHECDVCGPGTYCDFADDLCHPYDSPGDSCFAPFVIDSLPFEDADRDTTAMNNAYGVDDDDCDGIFFARGTGSNDVVYEFTPDTTGTYTIETSSDFYRALYVATDCTDIPETCLGGADDSIDTLDVSLAAGTTYYIIVDGSGTDSNTTGTFTLNIDEPCIPQCDGKTCGPDSCGGSCGVCPAETYCDNTGNCQAPNTPGDSCNVPIEVDLLPFSHGGDTLDLHDVYGDDTHYCPGLDYDNMGGASNDVVYTLTPPFSGTYSIDLYSEFDAIIYVVTDCRDVANTCEAGVDEQSLDEYLEVDLSADVPYFIIIDGYSNNTNQAGVYTVTIDSV